MNKILAKFEGSAPFKFYIEKATIEKSANGQMIIEGCASTLNLDHDNERMAMPALERMANIINETGVPLRIEHQKDEQAVVGQVFEASVDERGKLMIKASLDESHPIASQIYQGLKNGAKLGLSVGGDVKRAVRELADNVGKVVRTYYDVALKEVSLTPRPSNYDAWLVNKHIASVNEDLNVYYDTPLYDRFLFENPHLDYLSVIEKSIPSKAWVKVENENNSETMKIIKDSMQETKPEEKAETKPVMEEKEESTHSSEDMMPKEKENSESPTKDEDQKYAAIKGYVDTKFNQVIDVIKEFRKDLESYTSSETSPTASETKEKDATNNGGEETPLKPNEPEQVSPTSESSGASPEVTTGSDSMKEEDSKPVMADKPRSGTDMATEETARKEESDHSSSSTKEAEDYGEEYQLPELQRMIRKAKASGVNPLDVLVSYISKFMDDTVEGLKKHNKTIIGLEERIADVVRHDSDIQKSIKGWMDEPGEKKSVILGAPYAFTKSGQRFRLTPVEDNSVRKSIADGNKDFKSLYKSQLSSTANDETIR